MLYAPLRILTRALNEFLMHRFNVNERCAILSALLNSDGSMGI